MPTPVETGQAWKLSSAVVPVARMPMEPDWNVVSSAVASRNPSRNSCRVEPTSRK